jgi:diguanylate cyclase (GGDEF)-like protein
MRQPDERPGQLPVVPRRDVSPVRRCLGRLLLGTALATGAPAGWLVLRLAQQRTAVEEELTSHAGLYLYMLVGTALAFAFYAAILCRYESRLIHTNADLRELAVTDGLTGLRNSRYFHAWLPQAHASARRTGRPLSLVLVDLDRFKRVNDRWGHPVGDQTLAAAGLAISAAVREGDAPVRLEAPARVGGEEFAIVLHDTTAEEAALVADRVLAAVRGTSVRLDGGADVRVTASAGVASTEADPEETPGSLYVRADRALYAAKRAGRDRTVVSIPERADAASARAEAVPA